jgi:hypothetical protein
MADHAAAAAAAAAEAPVRPTRPTFEPTAKLVTKKPAEVVEGAAPAAPELPEFDPATHVLVSPTLEAAGVYVIVPRDVAEATPVLGPLAKAASTTEKAPLAMPVYAHALVAIVQWVDKKGVQGVSTTAFQNPITYPDMDRMLRDENEKEIIQHLMTSAKAVIGVVNFAETAGMEGLLKFAIVALSCTLRGKTDVEMAHALGHDSFTPEELAAGKQAYPQLWAKATA